MDTNPHPQQDASDVETIQHAIELARSEINRGLSGLAIRRLGSVRRQVEFFQGRRLWVEHRLALAEAFAAAGDPAAEVFYEDVLSTLAELTECGVDLRLRAHEHFARHLVIAEKPSKARSQFVTAKQIAVERNMLEDSARIALQIIPLDLAGVDETRSKNFRVFKRVVQKGNYTSQEQLAAWHQHCGETDALERGMTDGRQEKPAEEWHFERILRKITGRNEE